MKFCTLTPKICWYHCIALMQLLYRWQHKSPVDTYCVALLVVSFLYYHYTVCFRKSFATLKAYINVFREHVQCFELP
jgi:hypothetical protein